MIFISDFCLYLDEERERFYLYTQKKISNTWGKTQLWIRDAYAYYP